MNEYSTNPAIEFRGFEQISWVLSNQKSTSSFHSFSLVVSVFPGKTQAVLGWPRSQIRKEMFQRLFKIQKGGKN